MASSIVTTYKQVNGKPVLMREPKVFLIDDGPGKAIAINLFIGKRPIAAFGNSSGDAEMLQWTQAGPGARLMMLVHHDDAVASTPMVLPEDCQILTSELSPMHSWRRQTRRVGL